MTAIHDELQVALGWAHIQCDEVAKVRQLADKAYSEWVAVVKPTLDANKTYRLKLHLTTREEEK